MICSREKRIHVPGVGPTIIISMSQFKDVSELQSLSSHSPIVKVEQVRIVFCWLHILHTLPTSTMSMSRSVQWECPLQLFSSWCSISVVLIRVLPLEQPLSSQPAFFFLTLPSWRILSPRARQAGCWHGGYAEILCASDPTLVDKLVEQWWCIPKVVCSIPTQIRDFSTSLGERSSWSC